MADDTVLIEFGAKIDKLVAATEEVKQRLEGISSFADSMGAGFSRLGEIIVSAFSITAISSFVERMADLGLQTERTMAILGMTAADTLLLGGMAQVTGTSMEGLALSIERMSLNIQRSTRDAVNPQAEALRVLGLSAKELIGIPTAQYFDKLHDAVSQFNPSLNLTNAVMAIGGRGIAQIIPLLQLNGAEWIKMRQAILEAKGGMDEFIPGMADTHVKISLLSMTMESLGAAIFSKLKPAFDGIIQSLADFGKYIRDAIKDGGALENTFQFLTTAARLVASAIAAIVATVIGLGVAIEGLFKLAAGDIYEFEKNAQKTASSIEEIGRNLKKELDTIWSTPVAVAGHQPGVDARAMNAGLAQGMAERLKIIENEYKLEKDLIEKSYGTFLLTEGTKTNALLTALGKRFEAEVAAGEKTTVAYAKYALDRQKILDAANKVYEAGLNNLFNGIQGAFNSQLRGLLAGTTTWAQAFKAILGDMVIWAIQQFEKMAFEYIAHKLIMTTADQTAATAKAAAETAGEAATLPVKVAKFTSDITADAAEVFAGIFANLAPIMGPAAVGPAEAGQATILAQLANVPKFEVGTNFVPYTGLAIVHQGERIIPASQNTGNGQSPSVHFTIKSFDSRDVSSFFAEHGDALARTVAGKFSRQPSMRPAT